MRLDCGRVHEREYPSQATWRRRDQDRPSLRLLLAAACTVRITGRHDSSLEDRFVGLNLHGEEEEELDLSGEIEGLIEETRWIRIFRVHTQKPFNHVALFKSMRNA